MVDKDRRKKLAFYLRQLSVCLITNDDFEDAVGDDVTSGWLPEQYYRSKAAKTDDPVMVPLLELCYGLYDDTRKHKLIGAAELTPQALKVIARSILFLHSNYEYEWPHIDLRISTLDLVMSILTFGYRAKVRNKELEKLFAEFQKAGDYEVWPFFEKKDYENALKSQPFLSKSNE